MRSTRPRATGLRNPSLLLLAAMAVVGAGTGCSPGESAGPPPAPPPPPPAACLLDTAALAAATGLTWTPDASTASDTRCVYDPSGPARPPEGPVFVTVDVAPAPEPDPADALDTVAALCEEGSRAAVGGPAEAGGAANAGTSDVSAGFVCRFQGDNVFAAAARDGALVTVSASAVPPGTTAARLVLAFSQQVAALIDSP